LFGISIDRVLIVGGTELLRLAWLIVPVAVYLWRMRYDPKGRLLALYMLVAAGLVITVGKPGSGYNYFLEIHALLAIALGLSIDAMRRGQLPVRAALSMSLVAGMLVALAIDHGAAGARQSDLMASARAETALARVLDRHPGPMLSTEPYHLFERGQPDNVVEWLVHRARLPGSDAGWTAFIRDIEDQKYKAIIAFRRSDDAARDVGSDTALPEDRLAPILRAYRNLRSSEFTDAEKSAEQKYWVLVPCDAECGFAGIDPLPPHEPRFYGRLFRRLMSLG